MREGVSWSTALTINTEDLPGRSRKGVAWGKSSAFYYLIIYSFIHCLGGGWAGTGFFMDPTAGIAFVFGVQVVAPTRDSELFKVVIPLQNALYAGLKIVD